MNTARPSDSGTMLLGADDPAPGTMSDSSEVPSAVPSVIQSSWPLVPSLAENRARPSPSGAMDDGKLAADPGLMSRSRPVPPAVPSVTQISSPFTPSLAVNRARPPPIATTALTFERPLARGSNALPMLSPAQSVPERESVKRMRAMS